MIEYEFLIIELPRCKDGNGIVAASGTASTQEEAEQEAEHYASQYSQDGDIEVVIFKITREEIKKTVILTSHLDKP